MSYSRVVNNVTLAVSVSEMKKAARNCAGSVTFPGDRSQEVVTRRNTILGKLNFCAQDWNFLKPNFNSLFQMSFNLWQRLQ